jgi:hypothetical protein
MNVCAYGQRVRGTTRSIRYPPCCVPSPYSGAAQRRPGSSSGGVMRNIQRWGLNALRRRTIAEQRRASVAVAAASGTTDAAPLPQAPTPVPAPAPVPAPERVHPGGKGPAHRGGRRPTKSVPGTAPATAPTPVPAPAPAPAPAPPIAVEAASPAPAAPTPLPAVPLSPRGIIEQYVRRGTCVASTLPSAPAAQIWFIRYMRESVGMLTVCADRE